MAKICRLVRAIDENLGDEVLALATKGESAFDVAAFNCFEHLLDHFWFALAFSRMMKSRRSIPTVIAMKESRRIGHMISLPIDEKVHRGVRRRGGTRVGGFG